MSNPRLNILIAGGGTGGHLFPGISIAHAFLEANKDSRILFAGTDRPFEISVLEKAGFAHKNIKISGIKGMGLWEKIKTAILIPAAIVQSVFILWRFKADIVIGVGGYSSGPVAIAAWMMRIKVILHEQNIIPGITNKVLSRFANRIYVSFAQTANHFSITEIKTTGNPVRNEILNVKPGMEKEKSKFTILISGGSQGAHTINTAMIDAVNHIENINQFTFIHQTGVNDTEMVESGYKNKNAAAIVQPFFDDMEKQYEKADLIICRAGATTIAEVTAMGHSAVLIPFPFAADNHQVKNAQILADQNAARMITEDILDGKILADIILFYSENPEKLKEMAENSKKYGRADAAYAIVTDCYELLKE